RDIAIGTQWLIDEPEAVGLAVGEAAGALHGVNPTGLARVYGQSHGADVSRLPRSRKRRIGSDDRCHGRVHVGLQFAGTERTVVNPHLVNLTRKKLPV